MPSAEIITIGTEILLGEILDTNARYIARSLRDAGIDLFRKTSIGDNAARIAQVIQEALQRCDIVITTGGLGPTVDDPTRDAVALAMGVRTEFRPELWEQIQNRFQRYGRLPTENNRRQAYIPQGSIAVENPVGTAPSFIFEIEAKSVISLPGVPREMEHLLDRAVLPYLRRRYNLHGIIKTRILHTAGVGESMIDERIGDLELLSNPTVGLAAHSGQVDVRIAVKANSAAEADALLAPVEADLRQRLGEWVYGVDADTLEVVALHSVQARGWKLAVVEAGLGGELVRRLAAARLEAVFLGGELLTHRPGAEELHALLEGARQARQVQAVLGVVLYPRPDKLDLTIQVITPEGEQELTRSYGGPPEYGPRWAVNTSLDVIRKR